MTKTYTERFAQMVTEITANVKARKSDELLRFAYNGVGYDLADRTQRMALIGRVTDDYVLAHAEITQVAIEAWRERGEKGERPSPNALDSALIDRLTDAVLDEELTDPDLYKVQRNEYPFLSERQFATRHASETSLKTAEETGADGRDHRKPTKRRRTNYENWRVDRDTRSRNVERATQYGRDTAPGALVTYNLRDTGGEVTQSFSAASAQAEAWRERLSLVY